MTEQVRHTPGPWTASGATVQAGGIRVRQESGPGAASVQAADEHRKRTIANALLIAAAPDLLEAAKTVLAGLEKRIRHERESTPVFEGIAALHTAIRKATGG